MAKKSDVKTEEVKMDVPPKEQDVTQIQEEKEDFDFLPENEPDGNEPEEAVKASAQIEQSREITEEEADEFLQSALDNNEFMKRTVVVPGKRRMKTVFKEDERIIGDENDEIETYSSAKKKEYDILVNSARSQKPKVLYGRIDGVEEKEIGGKSVFEVVAHLVASERTDLNTEREITSGIYKIIIPAPMLAFYDQKKFNSPEGHETLRVMLNLRIRSVVEFVVFNINPDEEEVLASSIVAKQILSHDWYLGRKAKIKPGCKAMGHITCINRKGVLVNVFGAEVFIKNSELRWGFVNNPLDDKKHFYIGKKVPVRITSVETDCMEIYGKKYPYVKIKGTLKDATENPNKVFFDKYVEGQKYHGKIVYHLTTGEYIVQLGTNMDGLDGDGVICICKPPSVEFGTHPYIGQECNIKILSKKRENYTIRGGFSYMEQK